MFMKFRISRICLFLIFFVFLVSACSQTKTQAAPEEFVGAGDTGILYAASAPSSAEVYLDNELKGNSPLEIGNLPVGDYSLKLKKEGYSDFEKSITIKVGKKLEVDAELESSSPEKESGILNVSAEIKNDEAVSKFSTISISQKFILFYDFDNSLFTDSATPVSSAFSNRYDTYLTFTSMSPATLSITKKTLENVKKEDCANAKETVANLYSGQTLCVKTSKGNLVAVSGEWSAVPSELEWKELS